MKIVFEFNLPDDQEDFEVCAKAADMRSLIYDIDNECRSIVKYAENPSDDCLELAEKIRSMIGESDVNLF